MKGESFDVVFEDEYVLVINKKTRLPVVKTPRNEKTLTDIVGDYLKSKKEKAYPCHRLDKETRGLIIYTKDKKIQQQIMRQFRQREVKKKYIAVVAGKIKRQKGIIKSFIRDKEAKKYGEKPKVAITSYKILKSAEGYSVLELVPFTGRTNQLRIQLKNMGYPILGERKYALGRDFKIKLNKLALFAFSIEFRHPISGQRVFLKVNFPEYIKKFFAEKEGMIKRKGG